MSLAADSSAGALTQTPTCTVDSRICRAVYLEWWRVLRRRASMRRRRD